MHFSELLFRPQLFKEWITLSSGKVAIQWMVQEYILATGWLFIHWIELSALGTTGSRILDKHTVNAQEFILN